MGDSFACLCGCVITGVGLTHTYLNQGRRSPGALPLLRAALVIRLCRRRFVLLVVAAAPCSAFAVVPAAAVAAAVLHALQPP